ncbi:hypothetical protein ACIBL3_16500 [Kribbella sp. NPDC050124]|uniref:hypothetical protein n=1 Tax=Kribbella sp. NPDC050124 TaxID=3364114 RepID=UPI00379A0AFC
MLSTATFTPLPSYWLPLACAAFAWAPVGVVVAARVRASSHSLPGDRLAANDFQNPRAWDLSASALMTGRRLVCASS